MNRGATVIVASGVIVGGIGLAMLFRHPVRSPAKATRTDVLDQTVPSDWLGPEVLTDGTTVRIDPADTRGLPESTGAAAASADRLPRLARSYPAQAHTLPFRIGPYASRRAPSGRGVHRIVDGDTLPDLAARYLGSANRCLEIYEANRDKLGSPDVLPIGLELTIPPRAPKVSKPSVPPRPLVPVSD